MYRPMQGLGALNWSATGVSFGPLSCITPDEMAEAKSKCKVSQLRGLGAGEVYQNLAPMSGRLAGNQPCSLLSYPVCPMPTCIDQATSALVASCIAGTNTNSEFDCSQLYVYLLSQLPYCGSGTPAFLGKAPACVDGSLQKLRDYCVSTKGNGTDKVSNALCWLGMHDSAYWSAMLAAPLCAHAPVPLEPPTRAPAPTPTPSPTPTYMPTMVPTPTTSTSSGTMGMWGILALLAVGGGGYYMYRKYKR